MGGGGAGVAPLTFGPRALAKIAAQIATPLAVRTLAPNSPGYRGRYEGDQRSRDFAYHNGTAWPLPPWPMSIEMRNHTPSHTKLRTSSVGASLTGSLRNQSC